MRHRGVGQQPLHVGLGDGDDRADHHRGDGDAPHHRPPVPAHPGQHHVEQAEQGAEGGDLGGGGHEAGDRGRGALVDVGRPHVERDGADLEEQPHQDQGHADQEQRVVAHRLSEDRVVADQRAVYDVGDHGVRDGARVAVEQGDAEEEEGGGEGAEEEVLDRRLLRHEPPAAGQGAHQVEREGEDLQRDEEGQQVVGGGEDDHAADREEHQREDLGGGEPGLDSGLFGLAARDGPGLRHEGVDPLAVRPVEAAFGEGEGGQDAGEQDDALEEEGRPVHREGAHGDTGLLGGGVPADREGDDGGEGGAERDHGQPELDVVAGPAGRERLHDDADDGRPDDDHHGGELGVLDGRRRDLGDRVGRRACPQGVDGVCVHLAASTSGFGSFCCTSERVWPTAGSTSSVSGFG
ncbi:hypothetical protein GA0115236_10067 [Streptomyces sp. IgraMP-1]|nr:hypothetical protein GA0115236_10067 [Streptomyces sp. IgraMP-1]